MSLGNNCEFSPKGLLWTKEAFFIIIRKSNKWHVRHNAKKSALSWFFVAEFFLCIYYAWGKNEIFWCKWLSRKRAREREEKGAIVLFCPGYILSLMRLCWYPVLARFYQKLIRTRYIFSDRKLVQKGWRSGAVTEGLLAFHCVRFTYVKYSSFNVMFTCLSRH